MACFVQELCSLIGLLLLAKYRETGARMVRSFLVF
jgi:hypothetical protein